jgi:hypothetical protein
MSGKGRRRGSNVERERVRETFKHSCTQRQTEDRQTDTHTHRQTHSQTVRQMIVSKVGELIKINKKTYHFRDSHSPLMTT